jgi:hypothetical protein
MAEPNVETEYGTAYVRIIWNITVGLVEPETIESK